LDETWPRLLRARVGDRQGPSAPVRAGGCLATIRNGIHHICAPVGSGRCCGMSRWSRVSFDGSGVVWLHACRGRPAANPVMLRRPIVSIKRIKETVELHRRYEF
jgi:hypothetical protein